MRLLLGTKNWRKITEIKAILTEFSDLELLTFREQPFTEVSEDGATFEENARKKARAISQETRVAVLAEDSGLEVAALGGAPGVRSARFAGEAKDERANIAKLLELLTGVTNRRARFRCVAVLCFPDGRESVGEGILEGQIALEPKGSAGFGYDPVFIPDGYDQTLAELGAAIKNRISHRRRALEELI
ncbi:RdgB/HAM1 family non-canonical purine NTP pyrophosphatase [Candidatus Acetothermia bacterium]|jgi:XTP/dITP diphosphohydrolase|nr:RdgB/HAM1 family non-canonical purine NTP pyrophosphatase [Candidatus Acetothermia bacterium]MCI2431355.1 RdgB/HAM1 family non-canonical purine NTP pyrophosphatase [Candidatus Acetothermia bacterium]MCI2437009.1 RdgB/HAM1 family non-canonical purine NTP pyrophosphatase [Candidatus Acetothermia bacterium]